MTDRVYCCVPFCCRSIDREQMHHSNGETEWICDAHWKEIPSVIKNRRHQTMQRIKRLQRMWDADQRGAKRWDTGGRYIKYSATIARAYQAFYATWERCKAAAIERAAGI